ncbi:hypothetical protein BEP19_08375 [Ammoniphilus oxalaticus]|uniref:Light-independent protochlorophyllide reductase subunit B-like C-terminal domain-containing protein n=1 Tax=Ammoniphilus oxalaticus TaxID=66863 RepID=A0A419SK91_9BACL|nr:DUF2621 family protein [Ammoniphilus oxalaticus]RKD24397.1 hypothetical protein BEP19_08375 [Ammoniphilus oxalaticus]
MTWEKDAEELLDELVKPIPIFARPMARMGIERKIKEVATDTITVDAVVRGYLLASSGSMRERAIKLLEAKKIDMSPYEELLAELK